ncbi:MSHA biogenesis protein MshK [Shewanella waksmanii]|uniref:MSHA biogenesis protein MshK n=1 Tax=Shewanella waksmanii TaxID=213783 RepID=UPI001FE091EC|nr:MSHA biogenesis protein MshK [Shewanella waksmanii]
MLLKAINSITLSILVLLSVTTEAQSLRDPTRPSASFYQQQSEASSVGGSALVLQSTVVSGKNASAVINNKMYLVGERVQGVIIAKIQSDSVTFADGRKLHMYQAITEIKGQ